MQNASKEIEGLRKVNEESRKMMEDTINKKDDTIKEMESNMAKVERELKELKESKLSPGNKHEENRRQGNVCSLPVVFSACIYNVQMYAFVKPGACQPVAGVCLVYKNSFCADVCMCMCPPARPPPRLLIISGVIWTPCDWLNKFYSCYVATVLVIVKECGTWNWYAS